MSWAIFRKKVFLSLPDSVVVYPGIMVEMIMAYRTVLIWISGLSLFLFLFSLAAVPWLVARIPEAYFRDLALDDRKDKGRGRPRDGDLAVKGLKNGLGLILVVIGIVMLFVPGQGLLTILTGMVLLDFPGKKKMLVCWVRHRSIQHGLNWIRRKKGVAPLIFPG